MKIIDLLNKMANGEIPPKIKHNDTIYIYDSYGGECGYVDKTKTPYKWFAKVIDCDIKEDLNDEVEILDEKDKDIPLIPNDELYTFHGDNKELNYNFKALKDQINILTKEFNEYRKENQ